MKSNSGNEYAALLATVLNGGQPAMVDSVARDGKTIASIFAKSGWMETSSEDSFNQFLTLGVGSKPMMVGYESQLLDLAVNQPDAFKQIKDDEESRKPKDYHSGDNSISQTLGDLLKQKFND